MKRIKYLDSLRGFAILLVIIGHISQFDSRLDILTNFIYAFHIPLFFVISGYLYYMNGSKLTIREFIIKKFRSLMIPYFVFSIFNFLLKVGVLYISGQVTPVIFKNEMCRVLTFYGNGAVWFLACLFFVEIIFKILHCRLKDENIIKFFISFLCIISLVFSDINSQFMTAILRVFIALGFYSIGYYLLNNIIKISFNSLTYFISFIFIMLSFGLELLQSGRVDLYSLNLRNPMLYIIHSSLGAIGILLLFKVSYFLSNNKILLRLGRYSMLLMLVHVRIMDVIKIIFNKINLYDEYNYLLVNFLLLCLVTIVSYLVSIFIDKYLPVLIGKQRSKIRVKS